MVDRDEMLAESDQRNADSAYDNWSERSACAAHAAGTNEGVHYFRYIFPFLVVVTTVIQNHRRGCRRVSNFCMGP